MTITNPGPKPRKYETQYPPKQKQLTQGAISAPLQAPFKIPAYRRCRRCKAVITVNHRNISEEVLKCHNCGTPHRFFFEVVICEVPARTAQNDL